MCELATPRRFRRSREGTHHAIICSDDVPQLQTTTLTFSSVTTSTAQLWTREPTRALEHFFLPIRLHQSLATQIATRALNHRVLRVAASSTKNR